MGSKKEWWSEGITFQCIPDCGRCCNEPGGIVHLSQTDAENLAQFFEMPTSEWLQRDGRRRLDGKWVLKSRPEDDICIYLDDGMKCMVYDAKPTQCSAFPWWRENLRAERKWNKVVRGCPGLSEEGAPLIDGEEIMKWVLADQEASKGFRHLKRND